VERRLLTGDRLPDNYKLIYRAPIESYVTWTKNISTATTSILGLVAAYHWATTMNIVNMVQKIDIAILVSQESDLYYFLTGFVLINLAIRAFVAKYPLRIYKSSEKLVGYMFIIVMLTITLCFKICGCLWLSTPAGNRETLF